MDWNPATPSELRPRRVANQPQGSKANLGLKLANTFGVVALSGVVARLFGVAFLIGVVARLFGVARLFRVVAFVFGVVGFLFGVVAFARVFFPKHYPVFANNETSSNTAT